MPESPIQALQAALQPDAVAKNKPDLLIAGAAGVLGQAVVQRLVGTHRFAHTQVLIREPMQQGMRMLSLHQISGEIAQWSLPQLRPNVAVVMFEPPRTFYERERALWTPTPQELPALAAWLHQAGVRSLAVVMPHAQGTLPDALKQGLANLDEHAVARLGFERLIFLRSAQKPGVVAASHALQALAHWMISIFKYMVPSHEQPVRASKVAQMLDALLLHAAPGIHVIGPEQVWAWAQLPPTQLAPGIEAWAQGAAVKST
jgi:hypothetical protein